MVTGTTSATSSCPAWATRWGSAMSGGSPTSATSTEVGAITTEHSSSELRVIRNNVHQVDYYFLDLTMHT